MKLNDDQVMREIVLSFIENPSQSTDQGLKMKDQMIKEGFADKYQLDRCAKILLEYYHNTGTVPPYSRQEINNESYR